MAITKAVGKDLKYGHVYGPGKGIEVPVKADQYFHRLGGHFVFLDANGSAVDMCASVESLGGSQVYGWLETPKDASGKNSWKSNTSSDDIFPDKCFVITGIENRFRMPVNATSFSTLAQSHVGKGCIAASVDEANATYLHKQKAYYVGSSASACLTIHEVDTDNKTVVVSIRPQELQIND